MSGEKELEINTSDLLDVIKQILADSKTLIRQAKTPNETDGFVETARHAASLISYLEENVKKMKKIDTSENRELSAHIKIVVDSSQTVKDGMIDLIKTAKTVQVHSPDQPVDEKVNNSTKLILLMVVISRSSTYKIVASK